MGFELWTPNKPREREAVDAIEEMPQRQLETEAHHRGQAFEEAMQRYAEYREKNGRSNAKFGQLLGEAYLRFHQVNRLRNYSTEQLRRVQAQLYNLAPTEAEARIILSGAITQIGFQEAVTQLPYSDEFPLLENTKLYYPTDADDLYHGTDSFAHFSDVGTAVAMQIKAVPFKEHVRNQMVYPVNSLEEVKGVLDGLLIPDNIDAGWNDANRIVDKTKDATMFSMSNQLKYARSYTNVVPCLVMLASPGSEASQIHRDTGEPTDEFVEALGRGMQGVYKQRKRYLSQELPLAA